VVNHSLSDNLYQKNTRFVYELIQNAEDNKYDTARGVEELPSLMFTLSNDKVVIDSNEDGFTEPNVNAICKVGESTKLNIEGYIGEKGIGFKSVFRVAHKVHIQSEPYSFAFKYHHWLPDSGLGMVTPLVEEYLDLPKGIQTSITLELRNDCKRDDLFREFEELPDTFLLFLKKLRKLSLRIERPDKDPVKKVYTLTTNGNRATITCKIDHKTTNLHYWIAKNTVTDMPEDEKRLIEKEEGKVVQKIDKADVVLAFPLSDDDVPIPEGQHVFAYLPLRKVGFKVRFDSSNN
jgi:hypothetical protein